MSIELSASLFSKIKTILIISPHMDDAVFSCGLFIQKCLEKNIKVTVANVFTEGSSRHDQNAKKRRWMENKVSRFFGFKAVDLKLKDAPYRKDYQKTNFGPLFQPYDLHIQTEKKLIQKLVELKCKLQPDLILAPLGVGFHIDHLISFKASSAVFARDKLLYYEDKPYAFYNELHNLNWGEMSSQDLESCFEVLNSKFFFNNIKSENQEMMRRWFDRYKLDFTMHEPIELFLSLKPYRKSLLHLRTGLSLYKSEILKFYSSMELFLAHYDQSYLERYHLNMSQIDTL